MLFTVNKSYIYTELDCYYIDTYVKYIIDLLSVIINKNNLAINIILGFCNTNPYFNNSNRILRIDINWEHTLVKKGGRSVDINKTLEGNVSINSNEKYLVRIERFEQLELSDIIIEYSIPNMYNIHTKKEYVNLFNKMVYISPTLFKYKPDKFIETNRNRNINVLTTFININEPRRQTLVNNLSNLNINYKNINTSFKLDDLENIYNNTKILINIHQTDHHHTFEELRVLPALLSGVVVISEVSPLRNLIPYNDFIIWCSYDNIVEATIKIMNNYDYYFNKIFKSACLLSVLHENNIKKLENKLL